MRSYAAVAVILFIFAFIEKTMLRFTAIKFHKYRTRGKKGGKHMNNTLKHLIFCSLDFEQVPRVLDRFNKVETNQGK